MKQVSYENINAVNAIETSNALLYTAYFVVRVAYCVVLVKWLLVCLFAVREIIDFANLIIAAVLLVHIDDCLLKICCSGVYSYLERLKRVVE